MNDAFDPVKEARREMQTAHQGKDISLMHNKDLTIEEQRKVDVVLRQMQQSGTLSKEFPDVHIAFDSQGALADVQVDRNILMQKITGDKTKDVYDKLGEDPDNHLARRLVNAGALAPMKAADETAHRVMKVRAAEDSVTAQSPY